MNLERYKVLKLTLVRKWFAMVAREDKKEEYRVETPWIMSRLEKRGKDVRYDIVEFRNGYGPDVPVVWMEYRGFTRGPGRQVWGAKPGSQYVIILLGKRLGVQNWNPDSMLVAPGHRE